MKHLTLPVLVLLTSLGLPAQAPAAKDKMGKMGQMADHMSEMMGGHREMAALVEKLARSFAVVQADKDPATLQKRLAEHGALLKELQTKVQAHSQMMQKMDKEEAAAPAAPAPEHKH